MDAHPTPFPEGKTQTVRSKYNQKIGDAPKTNVKEAQIHRQKRVFGTTRNPNLPSKPTKPTLKPPFVVPHKQPKSEIPVTETAKKSPEKNRVRPKKKSVCFQEKVAEISAENVEERENAQTPPARSPLLSSKARVSVTPYHSARRCSNCQFDRLETSSYWLSQIRLAESAGKHFVSAGFFRLAFQSKAEPLRNLRADLKGYLARHEYLSTDMEWRDVSRSYGLLKDESNVIIEIDSESGKIGTGETHGQEKEELKEQSAQESDTK